MARWRWLREDVSLALHGQQLAEHGGSAGIRDLGLLQSALARPRNAAAYGKADAAALAAAYAYGISRNHPFVDGNKRVSLVALELFLALNGFDLTASEVECVAAMQDLAAGEMTEREIADWIRTHLALSPRER